MLYLIKSYVFGNRKYIYKVGFTDDVESRLDSYFYSNPGFDVISLRPGDRVLEKKLHLCLCNSGLQ